MQVWPEQSKAAAHKKKQQLRTQIDDTTSDYDREKLQECLAKIASGVAVIKVGACSSTDTIEVTTAAQRPEFGRLVVQIHKIDSATDEVGSLTDR